MLPRCVSVIGAGSWGTALAILLSQNISRVTLWGHNKVSMAKLSEDRCNKRYLPDGSFPDNLHICEDLSAAVHEELQFLLVVPSHAFRQSLIDLKAQILNADLNLNKATVLWGTKGFDRQNGQLLSEVALEVLGNQARCGVISGPSFATETVRSLPTALTLACNDIDDARDIASWFRNQTTRVYFTDDPIGVQLGGAVKNVMAIAAGICDGLGYGANARAALITRGLSELTRLGVAMGGKMETFMGLTGVGDLILSCTDNQSRNRRYGLGIGKGESHDSVVAQIGQEIEGINTVRELFEISQKFQVEMPITEQVFQVVHKSADPAIAVKSLLQRDAKSESA